MSENKVEIEFIVNQSLNEAVVQSAKIRQNALDTQEAYKNIAGKSSNADFSKFVEEQKKMSDELEKTKKIINLLEKTILDLNKSRENEREAMAKSTNMYKEESKTLADNRTRRQELIEANKILSKNYAANAIQIEANKKVIADLNIEYKNLSKQQTENKKSVENLDDVLNREVKTIKDAQIQNAELRKIRNNINTTTEEGAAQIESLNKVMDRNNELIQENSNFLEQRKINIGNYNVALKETEDLLKTLIIKQELLRNTNRENSQEWQDLQIEIQNTVNVYNRLENEINIVERETENLLRTNEQTGLSFKELVGAITVAGAIEQGIQLVGDELKKQLQNVKDFETAFKSLAAITGLTGNDLQNVKQKALEFSSEFGVAGSEILKTFELVGSQRPELLASADSMALLTKQAIILAKASGIKDTALSVSYLTGIMNQFGLTIKDTDTLINALAASSQKGTGTVEFQAEMISNSAAELKIANIDYKEAIAIGEQLSTQFSSGSDAATSLTNAISGLQQEGKGFQSGQFNLQDALKQTNEDLKNINSEQEKTTYLTKLFGETGITAGARLLETVDNIDTYKNSILGTTAAYDLAVINGKTLDQSLAKLTETWNNLFIAQATAEGGFVDIATKIVDFITSIINAAKESKIFETYIHAVSELFKDWISVFENIFIAFGIFSKEENKAMTTTEKLTKVLKILGDVMYIVAAIPQGIAWALNQLTSAAAWAMDTFDNLNGVLKGIIIVATSLVSPILSIGLALRSLFIDTDEATIAMTAFSNSFTKSFDVTSKVLAAFGTANEKEIAKQLAAQKAAAKEKGKLTEEEIAAQTKAREEQLAKDSELAQLRIDAMTDAYQKELAQNEKDRKDKQAKYLKDSKEFLLIDKIYNAKKLEIENKYIEDTLAVQAKAEAKRLEAAKVAKELKLTAFEDAQTLAKAKNDVVLEILVAGEEEKKLYEKQFEAKQLEDKITYLKDFYGVTTNVEIDLLKEQLNLLNAEIDNIELPKENNFDKYLKKLFNLDDEGLADFKDDLDELYSAVSDMTNAIADLYTSGLEAKIEDIDKKKELNDEEIKSEEDKLAKLNEIAKTQRGMDLQRTFNEINASKKKIADEKAANDLLIAEREKAEKRLKLIRKAAIISQMAGDMASAISSLMKYSAENRLNGITAGVAGIIQYGIGIANIIASAATAAAQIKKMKYGGKLVGKSHDEGGMPLYEAEGGEYVVNTESTKKHEKYLNLINKPHSTPKDIIELAKKDVGINAISNYNTEVAAAHKIFNNFNNEKTNELLKKLIYLQENDTKLIAVDNIIYEKSKNGLKQTKL